MVQLGIARLRLQIEVVGGFLPTISEHKEAGSVLVWLVLNVRRQKSQPVNLPC